MNNQNDKIHVGFMLDCDINDILEKVATNQNVSKSTLIRLILIDYISNMLQNHPETIFD